MAWTKADIFNQALRHLGITEFVSDPDSVTDTHANYLRGFWEEQVRTHLEKHDWVFGRTYYPLGVPSGEESPFADMPFIYQRPPNCLAFRFIYSTIKDYRIPWIQGITPESDPPERRVYTTIENAVGVYTRDVTESLAIWDYSFANAISSRLAFEYSGVRAPKKSEFLFNLYKDALASALKVSASQQGDLENLDTFNTSAYESIRG